MTLRVISRSAITASHKIYSIASSARACVSAPAELEGRQRQVINLIYPHLVTWLPSLKVMVQNHMGMRDLDCGARLFVAFRNAISGKTCEPRLGGARDVQTARI